MNCDRPLEDRTAEIKFGLRPNYGLRLNIGFNFGLSSKFGLIPNSQTESYRHFMFCINYVLDRFFGLKLKS